MPNNSTVANLCLVVVATKCASFSSSLGYDEPGDMATSSPPQSSHMSRVKHEDDREEAAEDSISGDDEKGHYVPLKQRRI